MNILFMSATQMLTMTEGAGGLFDFNATLPLMAIQFVILTVVLTFIFYKPVADILEKREIMIKDNLAEASEKVIEADKKLAEYEELIKQAQIEAKETLISVERKEREAVALQIKTTREEATKTLDRGYDDLAKEKAMFLKDLEPEIIELATLLRTKLLNIFKAPGGIKSTLQTIQ